jgi:hypothetical protein
VRAINFHNSTAGAAVVSWVVDRDSLLAGFSAGGAFILSKDPAQTSALWTAPTVTIAEENWAIFSPAASIESGNLSFPLAAGEKVYVAFAGKATVSIWLIDVPVS